MIVKRSGKRCSSRRYSPTARPATQVCSLTGLNSNGMVDAEEEENFVWEDPEFQIWLMNGIRRRWITAPTCLVHQLIPLTEDEKSMLNDGEADDVCIYATRVISTQTQGHEIGLASEDPFYEVGKYLIWSPEEGSEFDD